jgi:hypothetical protein
MDTISSLLANANTTKPLRRRDGLVVLAFANKSVVPRILGWPGDHTPIQLYPNIPHSFPPSPLLATLAKLDSAGKYYAANKAFVVARGMKPQVWQSNPGLHYCKHYA